MDRIKKITAEILEGNKDKFGIDFRENKKILDEISIVRSKGLKNKIAGFITKFIKREIIGDQAGVSVVPENTIISVEKVKRSLSD